MDTDCKLLKQLADLRYLLAKQGGEYQNTASLEGGKPIIWGLNLIWKD